MDELTEALAVGFQVSNVPNNPAAPHPRFSQYKSRTTAVDQETRRQRVIDLQKQKRFDFMNHIRSLTEDIWEGDSVDKDQYEQCDEEMEVEIRRPGKFFKNQLMMSEWMLEIPENFENDWLLVPCPIGKRSLVVASRGLTKVYSRSGYLVSTFRSALPGGGYHAIRGSVILDCIYSQELRTYYILDMMSWKSTPMYGVETECRFFMMKSHFEEVNISRDDSKGSSCEFKLLPNYACDSETIAKFLATATEYELDGLLFYHKLAHYSFGVSPLALWLKPHMVPEILEIPISTSMLLSKPNNYVDFEHHVASVKERKTKRERERLAREKNLLNKEIKGEERCMTDDDQKCMVLSSERDEGSDMAGDGEQGTMDDASDETSAMIIASDEQSDMIIASDEQGTSANKDCTLICARVGHEHDPGTVSELIDCDNAAIQECQVDQTTNPGVES